MLGLLVILGLSWLLCYLLEKEHLNFLGLIPIKKRMIQFALGFTFIILLKLILIYLETQLKAIEWLQVSFSFQLLIQSFWYHLKSALTEDLVFRGALLYVLINRIGIQKAILISAITFGVYHWFSYGMLNSGPVPLAYVFITTGFTGYVWAYTFAKTKSIMMPLGFHFGWNLIVSFFYDGAPYGQLLFQGTPMVELSEWNRFYYALFVGLTPPLITLLFIRFLNKHKSTLAYLVKN